MEQRRLLELALQELEHRKAGIDEEIVAIQAELKGTGATVRQTTQAPSGSTGRRRIRTVTEREAQAQRMREYWAARRAKATKTNANAPSTASTKTRTMTDAQKKTISLRMKQVWAKRKAAAGTRYAEWEK